MFNIFFRIPASDLWVTLGMTKLSSDNFIERKIKRSIPHPDFRIGESVLENDVALLQMEKSVNFQWNIKPICLPKYQQGCEMG